MEDRVLLASIYPAKLLFTGEPTVETTGAAHAAAVARPDDGLGIVAFVCFGDLAAHEEIGIFGSVHCRGSGITVTTEPLPGSEVGDPIRIHIESITEASAVGAPGLPGGEAKYTYRAPYLQGSQSGSSWVLPERVAERTLDTTIGASVAVDFEAIASVQTVPGTHQFVGLGFAIFCYVSIETLATLPVVSITDVQKPEGDDGPTQFVFSVSLSKAPAPELPVEVDYYVVNYSYGSPHRAAPDNLSGPPVDGRSVPDFHEANGKLTFSAGGSLTQSITAEVIGDIAPEADEVFDVSLVAKNATLARRKAVGTILNDDDRTITVNSTADPGDEIPDLSECTLHEAIFAANAFSGLDTIVFDIPGTAPFTIQPKKTFWVPNDPVVIDGTTQPGYSGTPVVELDGSAAGPSGSDGLQIVGGGNTVRGLVLNRWRHSAISLSDGDDNLIERNYIGTDVTGRNGLGDANPDTLGSGISTYGSSGNVIRGNLISGLDATAIALMGDRNTIQGNLVGTTADGLHAIGNGLIGLMIVGDDNTLGGTTTAERNTISAAGLAGVYLRGNRNVVQGNFIGTGKDGTTELGNGGRDGPGSGLGIGVWGDSTANVIGSDGDGDADDAEGNVIAYTSGPGIGVGGPDGLTGQYPKDTLMRRNKIFANEGLGIDLALDIGAPGPNDNDERDPDEGPNHLQNTPILFLEDVTEDPPILRGELHSAPRESFIVDIYVTPVEHAQGDYQSAQGETWLGFVRVSTDDSGIATFEFPLPVPPVGEGENQPNPPYDPKKQVINGTATDSHGNTSELPPKIECDEDLSRYRKQGTACVYRRVHSSANGSSNEPNQQHDTVKIRVPKVAADIKAIVFKPDGTEDPDREVKRIDDGKYTRFEFQVFQKDNDPVGIWKVRIGSSERKIYLIFEQPSTSASLDEAGLLAYLYDDAETGDRDDSSYYVDHNSLYVEIEGIVYPSAGNVHCKRVSADPVFWCWPTRFFERQYYVGPFTHDVFTRTIKAVNGATDAYSAAQRLMETVSNIIVYGNPVLPNNSPISVPDLLNGVKEKVFVLASQGVENLATEIKGICRDYANILVSVLRSIGIPARVATKTEYEVRVGRSLHYIRGFAYHQWAEAYLESYGGGGGSDWYVFDAMDYHDQDPPVGTTTRQAAPYAQTGFEVIVGKPEWYTDGGVFEIVPVNPEETLFSLVRGRNVDDAYLAKSEPGGGYPSTGCQVDPAPDNPILDVQLADATYRLGDLARARVELGNPDEADRTYDLHVRFYREAAADPGFGDDGAMGETVQEWNDTVVVSANGSTLREYVLALDKASVPDLVYGVEVVASAADVLEHRALTFGVMPAFDVDVDYPATPDLLDPFTVTATLVNRASFTVTGVTASLNYPAYFLGSGPLTSFVPSLAPGETKVISWTLTPASHQMPASHYLELRLDSANGGSQRESLRIESRRPPTPRVYRREIPLEAVRNEPFRVSYEVTNVGDSTLSNAIVALTLPTGVTATTHTTKNVGPLMPGESAVVEWELIGGSIGTKHVGVRAESPASPFTDAISDLVEVVPPGGVSPWQNPDGPRDAFGNALDVSGDGMVVPLDALLLINELNHPLHHAPSGLLEIPPPAGFPPPYYDVNGDGRCFPLDALIVINFLNIPPEGEVAAPGDVGETDLGLSRLVLPTTASSEWLRARGTLHSWGWPTFARLQTPEGPNAISQNGTGAHHDAWHAFPHFAFAFDPLPRRPDRTVVDDILQAAIDAEPEALESTLSEIVLDVWRALAAFGVSD